MIKNKNRENDFLREQWIQNRVKNPGVSVLLSFFIMGLGQIYNGSINKGVALLGFQLFSTAFLYNTFFATDLQRAMSESMGVLFPDILGAFLTLILLVVWVYNIKDARREALYSYMAVNPSFIPPGLDAKTFRHAGLLPDLSSAVIVDSDEYVHDGIIEENDQLSSSSVSPECPAHEHDIEVKYAYKKLIIAALIIIVTAAGAGLFLGLRIMKNLEKSRLVKIESGLFKETGKTENLRSLAEIYFQKGNPGYAKKLLKKAIALKPDDLSSRIMLADFFKRTGQTAESEKELAKAGYVAQSKSLEKRDKTVKTQGLASAQIQLSPDSKEAFSELVKELLEIVSIDSTNHDAYFRLGKIYFQSGKWKDACYSFEKCKALVPENKKYIRAFATALAINQNYVRAAENLEILLKTEPENINYMKELAHCYYKASRYDRSSIILQRVVDKFPKDIDSIYLLGDSFKKQNDITSLEALYEKALKEHNEDQTILVGLADIYGATNRVALMRDVLTRLNTLYPGEPAFLVRLANSYYGDKKFEKAAEYYESLLKLRPGSQKILLKVASIYRNLKKIDFEIDINNKILEIDGTNKAVLLRNASLYIVRQDYNTAMNILEKILLIDPNNRQALEMIRLCFENENRLDDEIEILEHILRIDSANIKARKRLFAIHKIRDDDVRIEQFYKQMLINDPNDKEALSNLASYYEEKGLNTKSVQLLKKLLDISDFADKKELYIRIIRMFKKTKRFADAEKYSQELIQLCPTDFEVYLDLYFFQIKQKKDTQALETLLKMADIDPTSRDVWQNIYKLAQADPESDQELRLSALENLYRLAPDEKQTVLRLADLCYRTGNFEKAILYYEKMSNNKIASTSDLLNLASIYKDRKNIDSQKRVLKKIVEKNPGQAESRFELAKIFKQQNETETAREHAEYLWRGAPENREYSNFLLRLAGEQKDYKIMLDVYKTLLNTTEKEELPDIYRSLANISEINNQGEQAFLYWNALLKISQQDVEALEHIADYYLSKMNSAAAAPFLDKLLAMQKGDEDKWLVMVEGLVQTATDTSGATSENQKLAATYIEKALKIFKNNSKIALCAAKYYSQTQNYKKALQLFNGLDSQNKEQNYFLAGQCSEKTDQNKDAVNFYQKALARDYTIKNVLALISLSRVSKAFNRANKLLEKALTDFPESLKLKIEKACLLRDRGKYKKALDYLESLDEKIRLESDYWIVKGILFKREKRYSQASQAYEKAIEIDPRNARAWFLKAYVLKKIDLPEKSLECYKKAAEFDINNREYLFEAASASMTAADYDSASGYINVYLEKYPDDREFIFILGTCYFRSGKIDLALQKFKTCIKLDSKDYLSRENIGNILFNKGKYSEACAYFERALEIEPDRAGTLFKLGTAYMKINEKKKAVKSYRALLKIEKAPKILKKQALVALERVRKIKK